jgi:hypothetical protein
MSAAFTVVTIVVAVVIVALGALVGQLRDHDGPPR